MKAQLPITPSQTVGPFFSIGLSSNKIDSSLESPVTNVIDAVGEKISIVGKVLDGEGQPVPDAMLEIRQANSSGVLEQAGQTFVARDHTGARDDHSFSFTTVKPGALNSSEAPYIAFVVYMRGLLTHVHTRLYFSDEHAANKIDRVLNQVDASRRGSLIAELDAQTSTPSYVFDIVMQGEKETVFFLI